MEHGGYVANAIGTLFAQWPGEIFVPVSEVLDTANHPTIAVVCDKALKVFMTR
jgi:hypothetical protein